MSEPGEKAAAEIIERVQRVADFYAQHRKSATDIALWKKDYEQLCRWPRAAEVAGVIFRDGEPHYKGYRLYVEPQARSVI